jgi:membrane protein implicated in regulation of membrane protease activity
MKRFLFENGLTLFFLAILLLALVGQSFAGLAEFNDQQLAAGLETLSYGQYVLSSDFAVDVAENWQSEFLQFFLYVFATVWLVQRGSSESKELDKVGRESDEDQMVGEHAPADSPAWARTGGFRLGLYSRSLGLTMGVLFLLSWLAQSIAGRAAYNGQQLSQRQDPVSWLGYVASSDFWSRTLQNWQSEFLAVASMAIFAVYLRQRGSAESKPVGAAHSSTGVEG